MDSKQKVQEYRVQIRRKKISQKIFQMRIKHCGQEQQQNNQNINQVISHFLSILNGDSLTVIISELPNIKRYSNDQRVIAKLKLSFQVFYRIIIQADSIALKCKTSAQEIFADAATIIINITSAESIDFKDKLTEDIASPLIAYLASPKREINTLWVISNILYRCNLFSSYFFKMLLKNKLAEYIKGRVSAPFSSQADLTIYYYFVGGVVTCLGECDSFVNYKDLVEVIEEMSAIDSNECYMYILDGMIEHAYSINKFQYEILTTSILKKCQGYCKNKKSNFIVKYLEIVSNFLQGEGALLQNSPEQTKYKIILEQYSRLEKYGIYKNLQFCLQNRSPQVKKLLFEVAYLLIALYNSVIQFDSEYLYLTLAQQIKNVEKYDEKVSLALVCYFKILIISLLRICKVGKNQEEAELVIAFVKNNNLFGKIKHLLTQFSKSNNIITTCFDILAYLQDYKIPDLLLELQTADLTTTLQNLQCQGGELQQKRDILLDYLSQNSGLSQL